MGRLFGTNGVRGVANAELTPELALRLGRAIASWLPEGSTVALARDARTSGPMLEAAAAAGLLSAGAGVVRLGICPTPSAQYYVKTHADVQAGLIVTASHNPPEFNGLKLAAGDGTEASKREEEAVEQRYFAESFRTVAWNHIRSLADDDTANAAYVEALLERVAVKRIQARRLRVVLDAGGGPGALTTRPLLERLGCTVVPLFAELDGEFRGRKSEPTPDNLSQLMTTVKRERADLGIAHDGDADRCIFVDGNGRWVSGDQSLAILARAAVERAKGGRVVTPVSTSSLVEEVVRAAGGKVQYTAVGSPIVAREMMHTPSALGGEENGGVIFPDHQYCRDGAMTAAKMLERLTLTGRTLAQLVDDLPAYHQVKKKFPVPPDQKDALLERLRDWVRREFPGAQIDATDGLKIQTQEGWVLIRASGTEAIYRVFAESRDAAWAATAADRFVEAGRTLALALTP